MLKELHPSKKQYLLIRNQTTLALTKWFQFINDASLSPSIKSRFIGGNGCMLPTPEKIYLIVDLHRHAIIVDVGLVAE